MLTFNHRPYIEQAITAVMNQRCDFPIELIIGDDCSTDGTSEIVDRYSKLHPDIVRVIRSQNNVGMFENMLRCIRACAGDYIAICEGDDFWQLDTKLQMQVDAMKAAPSATLCHTDYDRLTSSGRHTSVNAGKRLKSLAAGAGAYRSLLTSWSVITATSVYKASVLRSFIESDFCNRAWSFADYNRALYASANGEVIYLPCSTATWRKVKGSASNRSLMATARMTRHGVECRKLFMSRYPVSEDFRIQVLQASYRRLARDSIAAGDHSSLDEAKRELASLGTKIPWIDRIAAAILSVPALRATFSRAFELSRKITSQSD